MPSDQWKQAAESSRRPRKKTVGGEYENRLLRIRVDASKHPTRALTALDTVTLTTGNGAPGPDRVSLPGALKIANHGCSLVTRLVVMGLARGLNGGQLT